MVAHGPAPPEILGYSAPRNRRTKTLNSRHIQQDSLLLLWARSKRLVYEDYPGKTLGTRSSQDSAIGWSGENAPAEGDPNKSPLAISPDTRVSQHAEGLTLLHIPSGQIFVCNRTAARIWQGATEGRCLDELSEEMSRQFRIGREIAQKDTCSVVSQMELHGLIVRRGV